MKKTVLVFGLISGGLMAVFMYATLPLVDKVGFDKLAFLGYAEMVLAFILVFFGIRSYRENIGGGAITFGRAFTVGIMIALISTVCYVIAWLIMYSVFLPDFLDKYTTHVIEQLRDSGATPETIQAKSQELEYGKRLYRNPFLRAAFTFIEPFPVGLIITLISAVILRKQEPAHPELATAEH